MRSKSYFLIGLLVLAFLVPATAQLNIFGPPELLIKGRVNFIQPTNFTVLTDDNQIVRVLVDAEKQQLPAEVQLGVLVEVRAVQGEDKLWYLKGFEKIQLTPGPGVNET